ncbi:MAG: hypothetical protein Ct9H300mP16_16300 [Pseudomonadota bacterium]|nr:MAG: hypothetical protein Ct9H300mP16_16300 [Pseudomonadota bacterium]
MATIDDRLAELSITLPTPPAPLGNYVGAVTVGNLVSCPGMAPTSPMGHLSWEKYPWTVPRTRPTRPPVWSVSICWRP